MARSKVTRTPDETRSDILADTGVVTEADGFAAEGEEGPTPSYILVGSASIPVSKKAGKRWEDRIGAAKTAYDETFNQWNQAFQEFRRTGSYELKLSNADLDTSGTYFANDTDENLTRENVKIMLRNTYTRNPSVEFSTVDQTDDEMLDVLKAVVNQLLGKTHYPGLNAKHRIRRWLTHAHLTNFGVLKLDFQAMTGSRAEGQERLLALQQKMAQTDDGSKLDDLYAELEQVEDELPTMRDPGAVMGNTPSGMLLVDPDCTRMDLSDAKWVSEAIWLSNSYIRNRFMKKNDEGAWVRKSDGKPPGRVPGGTEWKDTGDIRSDIADTILGIVSDSLAQARQKDKTMCWVIWDKLTKQISLWVDGQWDYPLWVSQDDLKLSRFYPYFIHAFTDTLDTLVQEGEASQYIGQSKEINKINRRVAFIRMLAFGTLLYNSKVIDKATAEDIVKHMENPNEFKAKGIPWDPEKKLSEVFEIFVPPDAQLQQLYDKSDLMRVVDRVNSVSAAQRGEQFKTNTTNKAVEAYGAQQASVQNELTDSIEDSISDVVHALCEIVVSKYTKEQVIAIVGSKLGEKFENMEVDEFNRRYFIQIASGSTEKPTSDRNKREAMEVAQAVGQIGSAVPMTALKIMIRMFKKAFSIFTFGKEDEELLLEEAQANLTKGVSTPQGAGGGPQPPPAKPAEKV